MTTTNSPRLLPALSLPIIRQAHFPWHNNSNLVLLAEPIAPVQCPHVSHLTTLPSLYTPLTHTLCGAVFCSPSSSINMRVVMLATCGPAVAPSWCNCPQFRSATPAESKQREPKLLVKISRPPPAMIMVPNSVTCPRVMHHEHCPFFPFFFYSFPVSAFLIPTHPNGSVSVNALHRFPTERSHAFGVCCCRGLARMLLGLGTYYDARLSRHEKIRECAHPPSHHTHKSYCP